MTKLAVLGGSAVEFEHHEDLVPTPGGMRLLAATAPEATSGLDEITDRFAQRDIDAFRAAGWTLVPRARLALGMWTESVPTQGPQVLSDPDGRLFLSTRRLVVGLRPEYEAADLLLAPGVQSATLLELTPKLFEVLSEPSEDPFDLAVDLTDKLCEFAEPVLLERIGPRAATLDPEVGNQWQLDPVENGGIGAMAAWSYATGSGVTLAIIDNGFDLDHPELQAAVHPSSGYFVEGMDGSPRFRFGAGFPTDRHGTQCAYLALARSDGSGGQALAYNSRFLAIACLKDQVGSQLSLAMAIKKAADAGADVISCSLGPTGNRWIAQTVLLNALEYAIASGRNGRGCPIFWAVSNSHGEVAHDRVCSDPRVVAVGRSERLGGPGPSAHGPGLKLIAPGSDLLVMSKDGTYVTVNGSSYAAPAAAATACLILERQTDLRWYQVNQVITANAYRPESEDFDQWSWNPRYGHGRLDAGRAVAFRLTT